MNPLPTLLVDDEEDGRSTLRDFLTQYCPSVVLCGEAASVREAVPLIHTLQPRLVFLDINMPQESGFALFNRIPNPEFHTIFVTAHDEHALAAIKHHALDYLLKPINIDELIDAVAHAQHVIAAGTKTPTPPGWPEAPPARKPTPEKLALPTLDGFIYVPIRDIIRCEAERSYTIFFFTNRAKLLVSRTLGTYELLLKEHGFIRVHHQHLISTRHVERYQRGRGGLVYMSDGAEVLVSQRKRDEFLRLLHHNEDGQDGLLG